MEILVKDASQVFVSDAISNADIIAKAEAYIVENYLSSLESVYKNFTGCTLSGLEDPADFLKEERGTLLSAKQSPLVDIAIAQMEYAPIFAQAMKELKFKFTYICKTTINDEEHTAIVRTAQAMNSGYYFEIGPSVYFVQPCYSLGFHPPLAKRPAYVLNAIANSNR